MKNWHSRAGVIAVSVALMFIGAMIISKVFNDNIVYFYSPSDLLVKDIPKGKRIRIGGLVKDGSIHYLSDKQTLSFILTDLDKEVVVHYKGIIPTLFKEGQGSIAYGLFDAEQTFVADEILAKHDENYMPKEIADTLKQKGYWQDGSKN